ncbi:hypothetical protein C6341_g16390 [Phytophthora cactorum]|nr:hypothetical protein C6341_g16390 [Phytophthora cactorum]
MKIFALTAAVIAVLSSVEGAKQASVHLRNVDDSYGDDSYGDDSHVDDSYVDNGYVKGSYVDDSYVDDNYVDGSYVDNSYVKGSYVDDSYVDGSYVDDSYGDDIEYASYVDDWGDCTGGLTCKTPGSVCVKHSKYYSQCKPATLPPGELCGQDDGTNVWWYPYCTRGERCEPKGSDYRCTKTKKCRRRRRHHHPHHHHHHRSQRRAYV